MIVKPLKIDISSDKVVAFQEKKFSLDLPKKIKKKLTETFVKICETGEKNVRSNKDIV